MTVHVETFVKVFDGGWIRREAIGRNLRGAEHTLPHVPQKRLGVLHGPFAHAIGDDRLGGAGQGDKHILVALVGGVGWSDLLLLLADE